MEYIKWILNHHSPTPYNAIATNMRTCSYNKNIEEISIDTVTIWICVVQVTYIHLLPFYKTEYNQSTYYTNAVSLHRFICKQNSNRV